MKHTLTFLLFFCSQFLWGQTTYYVKTDGDNDANGTSWATAFKDVQNAINAANNGDEIWVAQGTYLPTEVPGGAAVSYTVSGGNASPNNDITDLDKAIYLKNGVKLYGSFAGNESSLGQRNIEANETILSGDLLGNDASGLTGTQLRTDGSRDDNTYHVVVTVNDDENTVLDGFSIFGGTGNRNPNGREGLRLEGDDTYVYRRNGGGISGKGSNLKINNVKVSYSYSHYGGGIYLHSSNSELTNIESYDNSAQRGAGSYNTGGNQAGGSAGIVSGSTFTNAKFYNNEAEQQGGGMYSRSNSTSRVYKSTFYDNKADNGAGIFNENVGFEISNSLLYNNEASNNGGAIVNNSFGADAKITNVTFYGNKADAGGAVYSYFADPEIYNCVFWKNNEDGDVNANGADLQNSGGTVTVRNSLTQRFGTDGQNGNVVGKNPYFVNENSINGADGMCMTADDGLKLTCSSPAINAGDGSADNVSNKDITGGDRVIDGTVDMGAYESDTDRAPIVLYVSKSGDNNNDGTSWNSAFLDLQNAINAACEGDEIWVAQGTYLPTEVPEAKSTNDRDKAFHLKDGVKIYGGFTGSETSRSQRDFDANKTILSGDLNGNDTPGLTGEALASDGSRSDNSIHVILSVLDGEETVLDGFSITGGNANAAYTAGSNFEVEGEPIYPFNGGGFSNIKSPLTLANLDVYENAGSTGGNGGAMFNQGGSNINISDSKFHNNYAAYGGAVVNTTKSNVTYTNIKFYDNKATSNGAAMYNYDSKSIITNSVFYDNEAGGEGGAMHNTQQSVPEISNTLFYNNTAGSNGGAMLNYNSNPKITNVTFYGNKASGRGGGCG